MISELSPKACRTWHDILEGEPLPGLQVPLTVTRLVMAAGGTRDFFPIHHNAEFARAGGAPDMYANTMFIQGLWERCVRNYIGDQGTILSLSNFVMNIFSTPGQTVMVEGTVLRKWPQDGVGMVEMEVLCRTSAGVSVGPGRIVASLPLD